MPFLVVNLADNQVDSALAAMGGLVPKTALRLFAEMPLPMSAPRKSDGVEPHSESVSRDESGASTESNEDHVDMALIQRVVEVLLGLKGNKHALKVLECVLDGADTLEMDPRGTNSVRATTAGISRRLRKVFGEEKSPLRFLARSEREYFASGEYRCISYKPTSLGHEVYRALRARKFFE